MLPPPLMTRPDLSFFTLKEEVLHALSLSLSLSQTHKLHGKKKKKLVELLDRDLI